MEKKNEQEDGELIIHEHDFQSAKDSLKKFAEEAKQQVELDAVPTDGGLFWLGDHKVTGRELNAITSKIQNYLIDENKFNRAVINELQEVYNAFEALDKDYITGIVAAIKSAENVHKKEQEDRETIKKTVHALINFQKELEKIKHLMDIDTLWNLIEKQKALLDVLNAYKDELLNLQHLTDIDTLWEKSGENSRCLDELEGKLSDNIKSFGETIEEQRKSIFNLSDKLEDNVNNQQLLSDSINKSLKEYQAIVEQRINAYEQHLKTNTANIELLRNETVKKQNDLTEQTETRLAAQDEKLNINELAQKEKLEEIRKKQEDQFKEIEKSQDMALAQLTELQTEKLKQFEENQTVVLSNISKEHYDYMTNISNSWAEEKSSLNSKVATLTQKLKNVYILAGGFAAFSILQFLLNLIGIL